jgi:hypothetical protein
MVIFYGEELLAPRPTPKLEDHPFSAVRDCIFAATLYIRRPFLHPQPEDAPCRGDRDPLIMEWRSTPANLPSGRIPGTHWTAGSVGPIASLDVILKKKYIPAENRNLVLRLSGRWPTHHRIWATPYTPQCAALSTAGGTRWIVDWVRQRWKEMFPNISAIQTLKAPPQRVSMLTNEASKTTCSDIKHSK